MKCPFICDPDEDILTTPIPEHLRDTLATLLEERRNIQRLPLSLEESLLGWYTVSTPTTAR